MVVSELLPSLCIPAKLGRGPEIFFFCFVNCLVNTHKVSSVILSWPGDFVDPVSCPTSGRLCMTKSYMYFCLNGEPEAVSWAAMQGTSGQTCYPSRQRYHQCHHRLTNEGPSLPRYSLPPSFPLLSPFVLLLLPSFAFFCRGWDPGLMHAKHMLHHGHTSRPPPCFLIRGLLFHLLCSYAKADLEKQKAIGFRGRPGQVCSSAGTILLLPILFFSSHH
jgi:hypothetical protein